MMRQRVEIHTRKVSLTRPLLATVVGAVFLGLLITFGTITTVQGGATVVRDRNGRIIEQRTTRGDGTVEVRDANGRLKETRTRHGNRILIRDANGRLIRTEVAP